MSARIGFLPAALLTGVLGGGAVSALADNELVRIWSTAGMPVRERAAAVNRAFTNGTPMQAVVAVLGTNYSLSRPFSAVWVGPGPEPRKTSGLMYRFGEGFVTIGTTAGLAEDTLSGRFAGAGYSIPVTELGQTNRIGSGQSPPKTPLGNALAVEMEKLQGTWQLVYQQIDGDKLPDEKAAEMFHGKMVFAGDKIRYTAELPGFELGFTYRLYPDQKPTAIDLELTDIPDKKGIGLKLFGIYLLEDDTLKICHSETNRPTTFNAEKGSPNTLIVLKRKVPQPQ